VLVEDKYFVTIADILALHAPKQEKPAKGKETKSETSSVKWIAAGAMASIAGAAAFVLMKHK
jgi:hypothetical protein